MDIQGRRSPPLAAGDGRTKKLDCGGVLQLFYLERGARLMLQGINLTGKRGARCGGIKKACLQGGSLYGWRRCWLELSRWRQCCCAAAW